MAFQLLISIGNPMKQYYFFLYFKAMPINLLDLL